MKSSVFPSKAGRTAMFVLGSAYLDPNKQLLYQKLLRNFGGIHWQPPF